jgi:hypothetical protein
MAKKKAAGTGEAKADEGAAALESVESANSGVPLHSFEASRGPIESKAASVKEAFGVEETAATTKAKGKSFLVKSRVPTYTTQGRTFHQTGALVNEGAFTAEQWAALRANANVIISKAETGNAD